MAFVAQKKTRYVVGNVNLLRTYLEAHKFIIGKKKMASLSHIVFL